VNPVAKQRLRDGWTSVELREIGRIVTGSTPSKAKTEYYGGSFPFVKPPELCHGPVNDAKDKLSDKGAEVADVAPVGSVLVSCIGNLGKTGRATQPVAFNQQINAIIPNNSNASKWIFYAVQTSDFASQLANIASATTIAIVNKGKFSGLRIPVAPEDEQREIVAEIEKQFTRLEAGVAGLRRVQANLKRYRTAVLKAACEGKLVPTEAELARERQKVAAASRRWSSEENQSRDGSATQEGPGYETGAQLLERALTERRQMWNGKGKYKEPTKPDTTNLPPLADGWTWARLDAMAALKGGITVDKNRKSATARRVPYLRVANVQRGHLDLSELKEIEAPESDIAELRLVQGDILFTEGGDRDKLGRGWIWESQVFECIHQNHVFRARLYATVMSPKFVSWWGNSFGQIHFLREGKQTTNLASINLSKLSEFPIPIPPVAEQHRIVAEVERRLSLVEELEAVVNANLQRATRLRQSILQRAFEGNLLRDEQENLSGKAHDLPLAAESSASYGRAK
jgi:type I restriction enzyme S subunit